MRCIYFAVLVAAACASSPRTAVVDGREVPRPSLELDGQPYSVRHERAHPRPGGASSGLTDSGGDIRGRVCGMNVDYGVAHRGDHVQLVGSLDGAIASNISVRDEGEARIFTGQLGPMGVTLTLRPESLQGSVGRRVFALEPYGDELRGYMRSEGVLGASPIIVQGRAALAAMTPADQAALLPNLLTCSVASSQYHSVSTLVVGFGGRMTDVPPETSSVYTHSR